MLTDFTFKHMDSSDALEQYARQKIEEKLFKYITKPISAHFTFEVKGHDHYAHCSVHGGDGFDLEASAQANDMYGSIDLLSDKVEAQLKKQKEKLKDHRGKSDESKFVEADQMREQALEDIDENDES